MGDLSKALALSKPFSFKGKEYKISPLDFYKLAKFSVWLEEGAYRSAERARGYLPYNSYRMLLNGIASDVGARLYEPGGGVFNKSEQTTAGQRKLLELQIEDMPEEVFLDLWIDEIKREEALQKATEANSDPFVKKMVLSPM